MKLINETFRGEARRLGDQRLTNGFAQRALNARLLSGDLEAWHQPRFETTLGKATGGSDDSALADGGSISDIQTFNENITIRLSWGADKSTASMEDFAEDHDGAITYAGLESVLYFEESVEDTRFGGGAFAQTDEPILFQQGEGMLVSWKALHYFGCGGYEVARITADNDDGSTSIFVVEVNPSAGTIKVTSNGLVQTVDVTFIFDNFTRFGVYFAAGYAEVFAQSGDQLVSMGVVNSAEVKTGLYTLRFTGPSAVPGLLVMAGPALWEGTTNDVLSHIFAVPQPSPEKDQFWDDITVIDLSYEDTNVQDEYGRNRFLSTDNGGATVSRHNPSTGEQDIRVIPIIVTRIHEPEPNDTIQEQRLIIHPFSLASSTLQNEFRVRIYDWRGELQIQKDVTNLNREEEIQAEIPPLPEEEIVDGTIEETYENMFVWIKALPFSASSDVFQNARLGITGEFNFEYETRRYDANGNEINW